METSGIKEIAKSLFPQSPTPTTNDDAVILFGEPEVQSLLPRKKWTWWSKSSRGEIGHPVQIIFLAGYGE